MDWRPEWVRNNRRGDDSRGGSTVDLLVIHQTNGTTPAHLNFVPKSAFGPAAHYYIDLDGHVLKQIDEASRAYHADAGDVPPDANDDDQKPLPMGGATAACGT